MDRATERLTFECKVWRSRNLGAISALLDEGADPNLPVEGVTPITYALVERAWDVVALMLDRGAGFDLNDPTYADRGGAHSEGAFMTVLRSMATGGLPDEARWRWMVSRGADINFALRGQWTALWEACTLDRWELCSLFVALGADLEFRNKDGETLLLSKVRWGHAETLYRLMDLGADCGARDAKGRSALSLSIEGGGEAKVRLLLSKGVEPDEDDLKLADELGHEGIAALLAGSPLPLPEGWIALMQHTIEAGWPLSAGEDERIALVKLHESHMGFMHHHPSQAKTLGGLPRGEERPEAWVRERLAWWVLHRGPRICAHLAMIGPIYGFDAPDEAALEARVRAESPELVEAALVTLDEEGVWGLLREALEAGAHFHENERSERGSTDSASFREGEFWFSGMDDRGEYEHTLAPEDARRRLCSWLRFNDGFVRLPYSNAIEASLKTLGAATARSWISARQRQ